MPVFKGVIPEHRDHHPILGAIEACVARPLSNKERLESAGARASLEKEWGRLRKIDTWNEKGVREWFDVAAEARRSDTKVHVGRIFDICVELPLGDPARKCKGRVVFQGNQAKDENWEVAVFQDLSSCPATMEAGKKPAICSVLLMAMTFSSRMLSRRTHSLNLVVILLGFAYPGSSGLSLGRI